MSSIRLLVVDDHRLFVAGLRSLLDAEPGIAVVGAVADGLGAVEGVRREAPDVVLMDLSMPGMDGIQATRIIREEAPDAKVLCLSMHAEREFVDVALRAGACGYLLKDGAVDELVRAIHVVARGRVYLSPEVATGLVEDYRERKGSGAPGAALSQREREVLKLIADGLSTKQVAARLGLSIKTVSTHRDNLMRKLGIRSIAGLTKYAVREGLSVLDPTRGPGPGAASRERSAAERRSSD